MARRSSISSMPRAWRSTGPCVHAACPRMSRPAKDTRAGGSKVAQYPAHALREGPDGGGDVAAIEALSRGRDARRPVPATARVGLHEAAQRACEGGLHEELAHPRRTPAGVEHVGAARRIEIELGPALGNGEELVHVLVHGEAVLRVVKRGGEHLAEA